jgi:hypothetical protein
VTFTFSLISYVSVQFVINFWLIGRYAGRLRVSNILLDPLCSWLNLF